MEKFVNLISSYRWWFIALTIIITCFFAFNAKGLKSNNSIEIWLDQGAPAIEFYHKFKEDFGNEEFLLIAVNDGDIFSKDGIKFISNITSKIDSLKGIGDVISISTIFKQKLKTPYFKNLLAAKRAKEDPGPKVDVLKIFEQELLKDPIYVDSVVSKDGAVTAVVAIVNGPYSEYHDGIAHTSGQNWSEYRKWLMVNVRETLYRVKDETNSNAKIYIGGPTVINAELDRMSQKDMATLVPLMFGISFVVLIILFRKVTGVILPMVAIGISNVWTMGLYAVCGNSMNMVSGIMAPVIFVIALATSVHILNHCYYGSVDNLPDKRTLTGTIKSIGVPCFFSCLTTAIGFMSLSVSDVIPVKTTGVFTAAGIMMSFFVTIVLITVTFLFMGRRRGLVDSKEECHQADSRLRFFDNFLNWVGPFVCRQSGEVLILCAVLITVSILGILRLKVESDIVRAFPDESEIIISNDYIENNLTGLLPLEIIITKKNNDSVTDHAVLTEVDKFQSYLKGLNDIKHTLSISDIVKSVNRMVNNGRSAYYMIPQSSEKINSYVDLASLHGGGIVNSFLNKDRTSTRISTRMLQVGTDRYGVILQNIDDYIKSSVPDSMVVRITGVVHLLIKMQEYLLESQIKTFSLAFAVIFVVMIILLRSLKLALISMIPNLMPIVLTIGAMGYLGIKLDSGTMMIASVALGIAVDDTIHFLYRFKKEFKKGGDLFIGNDHSALTIQDDYLVAINKTMVNTGRAIIFTSIVAFCGFLALCLSNFKPIQYFGLLTAITMVSALIADIFVLPCFLLVFRPKFSKG